MATATQGNIKFKDEYDILYHVQWSTNANNILDIITTTHEPRIYGEHGTGRIENHKLYVTGLISTKRQILQPTTEGYTIIAEGEESQIGEYLYNDPCERYNHNFTNYYDNILTSNINLIATEGPRWTTPDETDLVWGDVASSGQSCIGTSTQFEWIDAWSNTMITSATTRVQPYLSATGATDTAKITAFACAMSNIVGWDNFAALLGKSTQNIGTGTTGYVLGGLTDNTAYLIGSPTWTTNGLTFNGTNQFALIEFDDPQIQTQNNLTILARIKPTNASATESGHSGAISNEAATSLMFFGLNTSLLSGEVVAAGQNTSSTQNRLGASSLTYAASEDYIETWQANPCKLWKNKNEINLDLTYGASTDFSPLATGMTGNNDLVLFGDWSGYYTGGFTGVSIVTVVLFQNVTQLQLSAIIDAMNEL